MCEKALEAASGAKAVRHPNWNLWLCIAGYAIVKDLVRVKKCPIAKQAEHFAQESCRAPLTMKNGPSGQR